MNLKVIEELNILGYDVLYIIDYDFYYIVSSHSFVDPSSHIYTNEITGKNITTNIKNIESNFLNQHAIHSIIENNRSSTFRFPNGIKWIYYSQTFQ